MTCPRCGAAVVAHQKFCDQCGSALPRGEGSPLAGAAGNLGRGPLQGSAGAAQEADEEPLARLRRFAGRSEAELVSGAPSPPTASAPPPPEDQADRLRELAPPPVEEPRYWAQGASERARVPERSRQARTDGRSGATPRWLKGLAITGAILAGAALVALLLLKLLLPDEIMPPEAEPVDPPTKVEGNPLPPGAPQVGRVAPTRGVDADNRPLEPVTEFLTSDPGLFVSVQVRNGQGEGELTGAWYLNDEPLSSKGFTVAEAADQYYAFAIEPRQGQRLLEGLYRLDLELNGEWAGRAEFVVRAPEPPGLPVGHQAINRVSLATSLDGQGLPVETTNHYGGAAESFFASVEVKSPPAADLRVAWYYQDQLIDATSVSLTAGRSEVRGFKLTRSEAAWPAGSYYVEVYLGDTLAQRLPFEVR